MLAQNNEYLQETVSGVRQLTAEEQIRQQCQAREDYLYWERIRQARAERLETDLADTQTQLTDTQAQLADALAENAALSKELEKLRAFKAAHTKTD